MTKKNFIFIAETLKSALVNENADVKTIEGLTQQFIGRLSALNPKFDAKRFYDFIFGAL